MAPGKCKMYFCSALKYFPGLVFFLLLIGFLGMVWFCFVFYGTPLLWLEGKEPDGLAGSCLPGKIMLPGGGWLQGSPASAPACFCPCPDPAGFLGGRF